MAMLSRNRSRGFQHDAHDSELARERRVSGAWESIANIQHPPTSTVDSSVPSGVACSLEPPRLYECRLRQIPSGASQPHSCAADFDLDCRHLTFNTTSSSNKSARKRGQRPFAMVFLPIRKRRRAWTKPLPRSGPAPKCVPSSKGWNASCRTWSTKWKRWT